MNKMCLTTVAAVCLVVLCVPSAQSSKIAICSAMGDGKIDILFRVANLEAAKRAVRIESIDWKYKANYIPGLIFINRTSLVTLAYPAKKSMRVCRAAVTRCMRARWKKHKKKGEHWWGYCIEKKQGKSSRFRKVIELR